MKHFNRLYQMQNGGIPKSQYYNQLQGVFPSGQSMRSNWFNRTFGNITPSLGENISKYAGIGQGLLNLVSPFINTYQGIRQNINTAQNRKKLLELSQTPINTQVAQAINAGASIPDAYQTSSGINLRNVAEDFQGARQDIRESEAAGREAIRNLSGSQEQAAAQLLRNKSQGNYRKLAESQAQAQSQEKARVDAANIQIANQNAQIMTQYAKDRAKFDNEKLQRLYEARLADSERRVKGLEYDLQLDYADRLNDLRYAAQNPSTRKFLGSRGLNTLTGVGGSLQSLSDLLGNLSTFGGK